MKSNKDKLEIVFLGVITVFLLALLTLSAIHFKTKNNNSKMLEENDYLTGNSVDKSTTSYPTATPSSSDLTDNSDKRASKPSNEDNSVSSGNTNTNSSIENVNSIDSNFTSQESIVSYWESRSSTLDNYQNEEDETFRKKAKQTFIDIVDFLFYDSTIKGYTFKELTTEAKLKIIEIACKIDYKIDKYFPNYKESIKDKYENLKGKAALLYLETTAKLCENVGSSACAEARRNFSSMKENFGFTWNIIKSATSSSYNSLKTILNEWYQSIKS